MTGLFIFTIGMLAVVALIWVFIWGEIRPVKSPTRKFRKRNDRVQGKVATSYYGGNSYYV